MSILTEKQILKPYIKKATGYIKSLLSAQHVEMKDGKTLQTSLDEINSNLGYEFGSKSIGAGSNEMGYYKKYTDGRLEMWATITDLYSSIKNADGSIYRSGQYTILFPIQSLTPCQVDFSLSAQGAIWGSLFTDADKFKTQVQYQVYATRAFETAYWSVHYHAWGTWK